MWSWPWNRGWLQDLQRRALRQSDDIAQLIESQNALAREIEQLTDKTAEIESRQGDQTVNLSNAMNCSDKEHTRYAVALTAIDDRLECLSNSFEGHVQSLERLRTDLARIEEQSRVDLMEYRETTAAIALATINRRSSSTTAQALGPGMPSSSLDDAKGVPPRIETQAAGKVSS